MTEQFDAPDLAIERATVITMDGTGTVKRNATITIRDGMIQAIAGPRDSDSRPTARRTIDVRGGIVMPGLVNAHTHLAMTLLRGLADDCDLDGFLARMLPAEGALLSPSTVALGTELAVAECFRSGITSALDMYFFLEAAHEVAERTGFRLHSGPVFIEFPGPDQRDFAERMAWADDFLSARSDTIGSTNWLSPHSTYLLSQDQLTQIRELAEKHGARVHIHACETRAEIEQVQARHGRSPIAVLHEVGLLCPGTVLAHGVHLTDADISLIASSGASVTHNPASNLKLASGIARVSDLLAAGVNVALGTDGTASGNDLDLWLAGRLAAYVAKGVGDDATTVPAATMLEMMTINGAKALGREHDLGSIEVGKRADLVILDPDSPSLTPSFDPVSSAAYASSRGDVRWVVIDGKVVVDDRRLTTIDIDRVLGDVRSLMPTIETLVP
ncbi:MAG: amidohydrolase family protein [Acidimicrobiia bacterium]